VCLTWDGRIGRVADTAPATAIAVVPDTKISTAASRAALPASVPHEDAAHSAGRAALLGAALAGGSRDLFAAALDDRLHEPYRAPDVPLLTAIREELPRGAIGATLSGSGPTVIVWTDDAAAADCAAELVARFPDAQVLPLSVSPRGTG
jgi:homoserine kinase